MAGGSVLSFAMTGGVFAFSMAGMFLVLLVQPLGLAPRMAVASADEADGGDGKEAGEEGLH